MCEFWSTCVAVWKFHFIFPFPRQTQNSHYYYSSQKFFPVVWKVFRFPSSHRRQCKLSIQALFASPTLPLCRSLSRFPTIGCDECMRAQHSSIFAVEIISIGTSPEKLFWFTCFQEFFWPFSRFSSWRHEMWFNKNLVAENKLRSERVQGQGTVNDTRWYLRIVIYLFFLCCLPSFVWTAS